MLEAGNYLPVTVFTAACRYNAIVSRASGFCGCDELVERVRTCGPIDLGLVGRVAASVADALLIETYARTSIWQNA